MGQNRTDPTREKIPAPRGMNAAETIAWTTLQALNSAVRYRAWQEVDSLIGKLERQFGDVVNARVNARLIAALKRTP